PLRHSSGRRTIGYIAARTPSKPASLAAATDSPARHDRPKLGRWTRRRLSSSRRQGDAGAEMRRNIGLAVMLLLTCAATKPSTRSSTAESPMLPAADDEIGFIPLFSEEALKKWRQCGPGRFVVKDGVATGEGGMGLWWYS